MLELLKEKPWLVLIAVGVVVLIAHMQSNNSGSVSFVGGGVAPIPVDPNAAAIQEAQIQAGKDNISTLASLVLGTRQSSDALTASVANTSAAEQVGLAQTSAGLEASLAQTQAGVAVAGINADSAEKIAQTNAEAQATAAQITAQTQAAITASNIQIAQIDALTQERLGQFQKDIARAKDNSDIVGNIVNGIKDFFTFHWL